MIKKILLIPLLLLSLFLLHSCGQAVTEEKPVYGGHLTIGEFSPLNIINPIISSSGPSGYLIHIIFNGLVKPDEHFNIVPDLAEKWEQSEDGLKWKFYLRKGVNFHDGRELTAEDVKFTYDLIKNPKYIGYYTPFFEPIEKINIIGPYRIEIFLNRPYAPLLSSLMVGILPKHIYSGKNLSDPKNNRHPNGTGPFKILSYSPKELRLKANKDYFDNPPYLDKISFKVYKDQKTLFAKILEGSVDAVNDINPENIDILKQVTYFKHYKFLKPFYYILAFQHRGIFEDKRVRRALNYGINKDKLLKNVLKGGGKVSSGPMFPQSWAYNKRIGPYPYKPKKALALLNEAGWKDTNNNHILDKEGEELDFTVLFNEGFAVNEESLKHIQLDLNNLGVSMKARKYPTKEFNRFVMNKEFEATIIALSGRGDPDNNYKFWHSSQIVSGWNFFSYQNKKVDQSLDEGRRNSDIVLRKNLYDQFQQEIRNDPPGIFLFWADNLFISHKRFKGVKMHPNWVLDLKNWYVPKEEQRGG